MIVTRPLLRAGPPVPFSIRYTCRQVPVVLSEEIFAKIGFLLVGTW